MAKDPAFLFYSDKFYGGTRTMLPEERACYIDLLIYQHQNGIIPLDTKRVLMFCTGVDQATLEATLEAKFKQTPEGWVNLKLEETVKERENYAKNQSDNGKIGQFFKKLSFILNKKEYKFYKENLTKSFILSVYDDVDLTNKTTIEESLKRCLSLYITNVDVIIIINKLLNTKTTDSTPPETESEKSENLIYPFNSEQFRDAWSAWLKYKKDQHRFEYKSKESQQAALTELSNLSEGKEETAISIIRQSVANGWKGLFKLKNECYDNSKSGDAGNRPGSRDAGEYLRKTSEGLNDLYRLDPDRIEY